LGVELARAVSSLGRRARRAAGVPGLRAGARGRLVLVLNAGSSTLKTSVIDTGRVLEAAIPAAGAPPPAAELTIGWGSDASREASVEAGVTGALDGLAKQGIELATIGLVAHRVVHGGDSLREPTLADEAVIERVEALGPLAPLHNPVAAATIRAARAVLPGVDHVAVFDTAFHATLAEPTWRYPLPAAWDGWGIRRYGFHGLSVAWSVERAAILLGRPVERLQLVVAHLGSGCSVTAVSAGRSAWTSMGMTPLEGLMMGTRAGSIDPGIMLRLLRDGRRTVSQLAEDLDHRAGLLGVSGGRIGGMRELEAAAAAGSHRAALAIEMFVERAAAGIGAAATSLPRLDAVVFTAGIGEHAAAVRRRIVERLAALGVPRIPDAETGSDRVLATADDGPAVLRVAAREDIVAARAADRLAAGLTRSGGTGPR
jgi:acetate kinase